MNKLKIAIIQEDLKWEDSSANLKMFGEYADQLDGIDLLVLPEMFNTGFSMNPEKVAQSNNGAAIKWMKDLAIENNFAVMASLAVADKENYYNRFVMAYPCTSIKWYDKRHLFRMGGEHELYTPGSDSVVFNYFGWRIKPQICYDLRFPVWSRNKDDYDMLVYVANWPAARANVWETLLKARAIENQCYVIGVNRIGTDGRGIDYKGDSMVINPKGEIVERLNNENGLIETSVELSELKIFREQFPVGLDADNFSVNNS